MITYQQASLVLSQMGADAVERRAIVRAIMENSAASFARKFPILSSQPTVRGLVEALHGGIKAGEDLYKHAARTSAPNLRLYIAGIKQVCESVRENPTPAACSALIQNYKHCESLLSDLRTRNYDDRYTKVLAARLSEELAKGASDLIRQLGSTEPTEYGDFQDSTIDPTGDLDADHEKFIGDLEKGLKCQVHHWEPWREGIVLFMDEDNTAKVLDQLRGYNDVLEKITSKFGYIMLRRGDATDIQFGAYSSPMSRWMFIRLPAEVESWLEPDAMEKLTKDAQGEADKITAKCEKDAKKLQLDTNGNTGVLLKTTKPLASIVAGWDRV